MIRLALLGTVAILVSPTSVAAQDDGDYATSMECLIAINESEALFRAIAGKPSDNAATFDALRDRFMTVLTFEGKKVGMDREAIVADFETRSKASTTIVDAKSAAQLDAAYKRQFAKAGECAKRI